MKITSDGSGELSVQAKKGERITFKAQWIADGIVQDMTTRTSHMQVRGSSDTLLADLTDVLGAAGQIVHASDGVTIDILGTTTATFENVVRFDLFIFPDDVVLAEGVLIMEDPVTHA